MANWQMQTFPVVLQKPGEELAKILGEALPAEAMPSEQIHRCAAAHRAHGSHGHSGRRIADGKSDRARPRTDRKSSFIGGRWATGEFTKMEPATTPQRTADYSFTSLPPSNDGDFEYYVEASDSKTTLKFPATAPQRSQSVIVVKE